MDDTSTRLYCGEQDLFAFMIDPTGWAEIDGEALAPGFFVWNSEVGKRCNLVPRPARWVFATTAIAPSVMRDAFPSQLDCFAGGQSWYDISLASAAVP